jgi:hypothetical protein
MSVLKGFQSLDSLDSAIYCTGFLAYGQTSSMYSEMVAISLTQY